MFCIKQSWWTFTCPPPLSHTTVATPCSSRELKTPRSLFSFPLYKGIAPSSWTAGVKQNRNRLWGQWRICAVWHKTQEDPAVVQGCRTEESSPSPLCATAPTRAGVSACLDFPDRSHQLPCEKRQLGGHYPTSAHTTPAQNLTNLLHKWFNVSWFAEMYRATFSFWYWVSLNKVVMASQSQSWWTKIFLYENKENYLRVTSNKYGLKRYL